MITLTNRFPEIKILGVWPRHEVKNENLKEKLGKDYIGPDTLIAFLQKAVSTQVSFNEGLESEVLKSIQEGHLEQDIFNKISSSILRGHSLDGVAGIALGLYGSKLLDSALTGLVNTRSFVTSGRRASIEKENIILPEVLEQERFRELKKEYIEISEKTVDIYKDITDCFGQKQGPQIASKIVPYNNPCDLYITLPLSTITSLYFEIESQKNQGKIFFPREIEWFLDKLENEILPREGIEKMHKARKVAPRDPYLHWNVFKAPEENIATETAEKFGNPLDPALVYTKISKIDGLMKNLRDLKEKLKETYTSNEPEKIQKLARNNLLKIRDIVSRYNDCVFLQTISSLSWRVWSEQKRHATLKQTVESIYAAADKAYEIIEPVWGKIDKIYKNHDNLNYDSLEGIAKKLENAFVIPPQIKSEERKNLLLNYMWISAKQHIFRKKLLKEGIEERDAVYLVPRNTRVRTLETYDLSQIIDYELPLRLCTTCEPERRTTSEKKEKMIKEALPELSSLIGPKCLIGYCPESDFCYKIKDFNPNYSPEIHKAIRGIVIEKAH